MKKLNITKEQFNRSRYFKNKYGKLEYVSESGKLFKTNKGKVLMFKESYDRGVSRKTLKELKSAIGTLDMMLKQDEDNGTIMMQKEFVRLLHVVEDKVQKALELQSKMKVRNSYPDEDEYPLEESTEVNEGSFQVLDSDGETTTLSRECPFCHKEHHITIDMDEDEFYDRYDAMRAGELIQNAFPMLDPNQREFIKTGICDTCWDSL